MCGPLQHQVLWGYQVKQAYDVSPAHRTHNPDSGLDLKLPPVDLNKNS